MKISESIEKQWLAPRSLTAVKARNAALVKGKYGEFPAFTANFAPSRQAAVMQHASEVTRRWREYPSLVQCEHAYGTDGMAAWLVSQMRHLFGKGEEVAEARRTAVAILSSPEFRPMKVTELMLFIGKFYTGGFGKVYGKATGTDIMDALRKFKAEMAEAKAAAEEEERKADRERRAADAMTWEEYARRNGMEGKSIAEVIAGTTSDEMKFNENEEPRGK